VSDYVYRVIEIVGSSTASSDDAIRTAIERASAAVQNIGWFEVSPEVSAAVRLISAPVFDASGQVALALTLHDFPRPPANAGIGGYAARLVEAAGRVTQRLGGRSPA
jgi:flavin-binding protein dodecin